MKTLPSLKDIYERAQQNFKAGNYWEAFKGFKKIQMSTFNSDSDQMLDIHIAEDCDNYLKEIYKIEPDLFEMDMQDEQYVIKKQNPLKGLKLTYIEGKHEHPHADFRKDQYNELRKKKNILSYALTEVTKKEEEDAYNWWIKHICFRSKEYWDHTMETWTPYPHVHLLPTSLGVTIMVVCPNCNEEKNVTDYGRW